MVISRFAGTIDAGDPGIAPAGGGTMTVVFLKLGMNFDTGSLRPILPSSTSIMAAMLVTAFDIDAMRKIVSFCIGALASMSRLP